MPNNATAGITEENRKLDDSLFAEAITNYNSNAKSPLLISQANHEFTRLKASLTYSYLQPFNAFTHDVYAAMIVRYAAEMEHEAPKVPYRRDDSGDKRNNAHSSNSTAGISFSDLGLAKKKADAQKELTGLRQEQRVGILPPEKSARLAELQQILDDKGLTPIQKQELVPLDINTPDADLNKPSVSASQIKELLARRKKEGWVRP
jgi:hypothetical protein